MTFANPLGKRGSEIVSYSRWGNSVWYTYWATSGPKHRDGQIFIVAGVATTTYGEMKEDFDGVLAKIIAKALDPQVFACLKEVTQNQTDELARYMKVFMLDVDEEYSEKTDGPDEPPATEDQERSG